MKWIILVSMILLGIAALLVSVYLLSLWFNKYPEAQERKKLREMYEPRRESDVQRRERQTKPKKW